MTRRIRVLAYLGGLLAALLAADRLPNHSAAEDAQPAASESPRDQPGNPSSSGEKPDNPADLSEDDDGPVYKTDKEWKRLLTRKQYRVTRRKHTEKAFSGKYLRSTKPGTYRCVCCGARLFSSDTKYKSGTGWPSFWAPVGKESLRAAPDYSDGQERVEVLCIRCDAHLGHVFWDGPPPTGLRFCINSTALKFDERPAAKTQE